MREHLPELDDRKEEIGARVLERVLSALDLWLKTFFPQGLLSMIDRFNCGDRLRLDPPSC
jgi:hypothetical protein